MTKQYLFEALGEISSRTVQANTVRRYKARVRAGYLRWAAIAAAIIAVGTGLYVFRIADSTHGIKEETAESNGITAGEAAEVAFEEAAPVADEAPAMEAAADEAPAEFQGGAYVTEEAEEYEESADEMPVAEAAEAMLKENSSEARYDAGAFGLEIRFPENENWIRIISRHVDENRIEIAYKDLIAEADCTLLGVRDGELDLPNIDYGNAKVQTWEYVYSIIEGKHDNSVTVKQSENMKDVLVTWMYGDYKFAIVAELNGNNTDPSPIAKTASYISERSVKSADPDKNTGNDAPSHTEDAAADADGPYREAQPYPEEIENLQAAISKGMSDKELPFVISSSICENPLRVEVVVNTKDEALINKVKAYDKSGKLLKITYSQGADKAVLE